MKTAIIYASTHQGNTRRLVESLAQKHDISLIDASSQTHADLYGFDLIGFASGIDFGSYYERVIRFLREDLPEGKPVFFLYTCARTSPRFTKAIRAEAEKRSARILGEFGCRGYNTYGPWKLVGGMNKGHPSQTELEAADAFFRSLVEMVQRGT